MEVPLDEYSEYDDPQKRREIRSEYRTLMGRTQKDKDKLVKPESEGLFDVLKRQENLFDKVRHPREAVLDSNLLVHVTNLGSEQAKQLQTDFVVFDPDVFTQKLAQFMTPKAIKSRILKGELDKGNEDDKRFIQDSFEWEKLNRKCAGYFKCAPTVDFMLGPLIIEIPEGKQSKRSAKHKETFDESQRQAPEELTKVEEQEEATTREVERIYGILRELTEDGSKPISFFEFVVNPNSFGKTVENLFHLSFLVKDGKASVEIDKNGQPIVCNSRPYREQDYQEVITQKQIVLSLTMAEWREIIEVYDITEPLIPG